MVDSHVERLRVGRFSKGRGHYGHPRPRHARAAVLPAAHGTGRNTCYPPVTLPATWLTRIKADNQNTALHYTLLGYHQATAPTSQHLTHWKYPEDAAANPKDTEITYISLKIPAV